jgi:hypothetical protein
MGDTFVDYSSKIRAYNKFLNNQIKTGSETKPRETTVEDCDVIMIMDAYDVLLTPAARSVHKVIKKKIEMYLQLKYRLLQNLKRRLCLVVKTEFIQAL